MAPDCDGTEGWDANPPLLAKLGTGRSCVALAEKRGSVDLGGLPPLPDNGWRARLLDASPIPAGGGHGLGAAFVVATKGVAEASGTRCWFRLAACNGPVGSNPTRNLTPLM